MGITKYLPLQNMGNMIKIFRFIAAVVITMVIYEADCLHRIGKTEYRISDYTIIEYYLNSKLYIKKNNQTTKYVTWFADKKKN